MSRNIYVHKRIFFVLLISCVIFLLFSMIAYIFGNAKKATSYVDIEKDKQLETLLSDIHASNNDYSMYIKPTLNKICKDSILQNKEQNRQNISNNIDILNQKLANLHFVKNKYVFDSMQWLSDMNNNKKSCLEVQKAIVAVNSIPLNRLFWSENSRKSANLYVSKGNINFNNANPWNSLYGCILLKQDDKYINAQKINNKVDNLCKNIAKKPTLELDNPLSMPPNINLIVGKLQGWRNPDTEFFATAMQKPNLIKQDNGQSIEIGLHTVLTINSKIQNTAQTVAQCFSGDKYSCKQAKIPNSINANMYRAERVRQIGIAIIDIKTGKIEALASSDSPCRRMNAMDDSLESIPKKCPKVGVYMENLVKQDIDRLLNHAIFTAIPPASTIKPVLTASLLMDKSFKEPNLAHYLQTSNSIAFADMLFCRRSGGNIKNCTRPHNVLKAAQELGWNQDCENPSICGKSDVLSGRRMGFSPVDTNFNPISQPYLKGKVFINSDSTNMKENDLYNSSPEFIQSIANCASKNYQGCSGILNSQVLGQGNSRVSAVGVASMMGNIVSIANSNQAMRYPYILENLLNSDGTINPNGKPLENNWNGDTRQKTQRITANIAQKILVMMKATNAGGTASSQCSRIFGDCNNLDFIASKTGTADNGINLGELRARKNNIYIQWRSYAGVFKSSPQQKTYDKAFDVIVERNWKTNGNIDTENPAVDAGLYMVRNIRQNK